LTCFIQGGKILFGGSAIESEGNFVQPTIVEITRSAPVVKEELFGPVLYAMKFQVAYNSILCFFFVFCICSNFYN
jgi:aldehyde dehydrogenase family 7 member A1